MKTGRNLQEVLVELNRQNQAKQDFISPAQGMHLREDGHTFEINHLTTKSAGGVRDNFAVPPPGGIGTGHPGKIL